MYKSKQNTLSFILGGPSSRFAISKISILLIREIHKSKKLWPSKKMMIIVLIISFKMEEKMEMGKNENMKGISG